VSFGSVCLSHEKALLPKFMKAKTFVSGNPLLVKVAQAKKAGPEQCLSSTNELGWQTLTFTFPERLPLKVSVYSSTLGSLLWKSEQSFKLSKITLLKKQGDKEIYHCEILDPKSKLTYEFVLNLENTDTRLRVKP
ncbi:MAG: hypothetical protein EBQ92_09970, partial [Proteobacteria bacterium]|nr:hypothetical protein [Pseudomonadota bacterium]